MSRKNRIAPEHCFIPDTQVSAGVNTDHLEALGNYLAARKPDVIVHAGDHWDMPSLNGWEQKSSSYFFDKTYEADIVSGNAAMARLLQPIMQERDRIANNKKKAWNPRLVFLRGNHENRIERAVKKDPILVGKISYDDLYTDEWEVHDFLKPVEIDGILYCHYFVNPQSLVRGVLSGTMQNRLNKIKQSFTQGHQQIFDWGQQYSANGRRLVGCVAGAFYSHEEDYMGPQGTNYYRGIVYKHEVHDGSYDMMQVSLNYLIREWL